MPGVGWGHGETAAHRAAGWAVPRDEPGAGASGDRGRRRGPRAMDGSARRRGDAAALAGARSLTAGLEGRELDYAVIP